MMLDRTRAEQNRTELILAIKKHDSFFYVTIALHTLVAFGFQL